MLNRRAEIGSGYCYSGWWFITSGSIATTTVVTFNFYWSTFVSYCPPFVLYSPPRFLLAPFVFYWVSPMGFE